LRKNKGKSHFHPEDQHRKLLSGPEIEARLQAVDGEADDDNDDELEEEGEGFMVEHEEIDYTEDFNKDEVVHVGVSLFSLYLSFFSIFSRLWKGKKHSVFLQKAIQPLDIAQCLILI